MTSLADGKRGALRGTALLVGLAGYGFSMAMMVRAGLGLDPWDVFHQGLTLHTGMTIGVASAVVGVVVLLAWIPLRNRPGIGTVANVIVIAITVDAGLAAVVGADHAAVAYRDDGGRGGVQRVQHGPLRRRRAGAGPRDGLMTGLVVRTGVSVRVVRTAIEATVLAVGWLLGGTVGVGTVLYAFGIGPLVQLFVRITPKRVLAVSGWASVAEASRRRARTSVAAASGGPRRNRFLRAVDATGHDLQRARCQGSRSCIDDGLRDARAHRLRPRGGAAHDGARHAGARRDSAGGQ